MISWDRVPALRLLIPFMLGIIAGPGGWSVLPASVLSLLLVLSLILHHRSALWRGLVVLSLLFFLGSLSRWVHSPHADHTHYVHFGMEQNRSWMGEVQSTARTRKGSWNLTVNIHASFSHQWHPASGSIKLYIRTKDPLPLPGMMIFFKTYLRASNPDDFYGKYLLQHNIYAAGNARIADCRLFVPAFSLRSVSARWRRAFIERMKSCGVHGNALLVGQALVLGDDGEIPASVRDDYANTGAVHILSVSGLHVGMIYFLLRILFLNHRWGQRHRLIAVLPVIAGICLYALVTGMSPSVLRSAAMFILFAVAETWRKKTESVNTLAVSAFLLLVANPLLIFDVGFQLSYTAVFGILVFYQPLRALWIPESRWQQWLWDMNVLSVASQITTFPLILYYFGKFPVLFLLVNLVVIPFSTVLLYTGVFIILLGWIPVIGAWAGWLFRNGMNGMNAVIEFTGQLPFAVLQNISIGLLSVLLLYSGIGMITLWLYRKDPRLFSWVLGILLLFQLSLLYPQ
ncbi:MAG: ComEC/Rec2 family competence protein [Bacteroidia bacterium]|nr:ComEC/Rec2 family competence protein [Bacteroidia bacterium]